MKVDEEGEEVKVEEAASKRLFTDAQVEGSASAQLPGITEHADGDAKSADQDMDQAGPGDDRGRTEVCGWRKHFRHGKCEWHLCEMCRSLLLFSGCSGCSFNLLAGRQCC